MVVVKEEAPSPKEVVEKIGEFLKKYWWLFLILAFASGAYIARKVE